MITELEVRRADSTDPRPAWAVQGPTELSIYQTVRCNLHCSFCLLEHAGTPQVPDVTPELIANVIDRFPTLRTACIAGFGEPLLSRFLMDNIYFLRDRGLYIGLVTNGTLVRRRLKDLFPGSLGHVNVSVNATTAAEWSELCQRPTSEFYEIVDGFDFLHRLRTPVYASYVVTRRNYLKMERFIVVARDLGAQGINFVNLLPTHGEPYDTRSGFWDLVITDEDQDAVSYIDWLKGHKFAAMVHAWPQPISRHGCPSLCDSPFRMIGIDGAGRVTACRRVSPPTVDSPSFQAGFAGPFWDSYRESMLGHAMLEDKCRMCFGNWKAL